MAVGNRHGVRDDRPECDDTSTTKQSEDDIHALLATERDSCRTSKHGRATTSSASVISFLPLHLLFIVVVLHNTTSSIASAICSARHSQLQPKIIHGGGGQQVPAGAARRRGAPAARAPRAVPLQRGGHAAARRPAPPPREAAAGVPCQQYQTPAAAAPADRAGAARRERGQRRRVRVHARPGPAHRPHRQGPARRRALRPPPPRPLLLRRRRLEGLLLRLPVPAGARDAARHRPRLGGPPHRRRTGGAAHPGAGLRQLPGPGADARGEGAPAAVRPLLLPVPQRRVGGGRVRPHHRLPRDAPRGHGHGALRAPRAKHPQHEHRHRLPRPHPPRLPHALVQVDRPPVRGPQQPPQRRRARHAGRPARRQVQPPRPPLRRRAQGVWPHRRHDPGPDVAEDGQARGPQPHLHDQRTVLLRQIRCNAFALHTLIHH